MPETSYWVDGRRADSVPLPDRGLWYGDGVFETLLSHDGRPLLFDLHWQRLTEGLDRLGFPLDGIADLESQLRGVCQAVGRGFHLLRLTVTRGAGPRGYAPPESPCVRSIISSEALTRDPRQPLPPVALELAELRWGAQPQLAGIKHLNRLEQVLLAREARERRCEDLVVLGQGGAVVSAIAANLFVVRDRWLLTPALDQAGIAGTRRRLILEELGAACGLQAEPVDLGAGDLGSADELFLCSAGVGLRAVSRLDDRSWEDWPLTRQLQAAYAQRLLQ